MLTLVLILLGLWELIGDANTLVARVKYHVSNFENLKAWGVFTMAYGEHEENWVELQIRI